MMIGSAKEAAILHASNHPTRPDEIECLACGGSLGLRGVDGFLDMTDGLARFNRKHRACRPTTPAARELMGRRFWKATRRNYGSSANSLVDRVERGDLTVAPRDADDLMACERRANASPHWTLKQRADADKILGAWAQSVPDGRVAREYVNRAEPIIALLLWLAFPDDVRGC